MQKVQNWKCLPPAVIRIWLCLLLRGLQMQFQALFPPFLLHFPPRPSIKFSIGCQAQIVPSTGQEIINPIANCIPSEMLSLLSKRYDFTFLAVSVYWDTMLVHNFLGKHFYVKGWPKHHHRCALLLDKSMWSIVSLSRFRHCDKKMRFLFPAFSRLCKTNLKCHFK